MLDRWHPLAQGLVGCWLFNEGTGLTANDLTAQYPATLQSAAFANGGASLNGTTGYILPALIPPLARFTLEAWLNSPVTVTTLQMLMIRADNASNFNFYLHVPATAASGSGFTISGSFKQIAGFGINSPAGLHQHVLTYDGSTLTQYLDAKPLSSLSVSGTPDSGGSQYFNLGRRAVSDENVTGSMQIARVWNQGQSAASVASLYSDPYQMIQPPGVRRMYSYGALNLRFGIQTGGALGSGIKTGGRL